MIIIKSMYKIRNNRETGKGTRTDKNTNY